MTDEDIFEAALNLEDTSYAKGFTEGHADGSRAGTLEGRAFGLQKGFEKFFEIGQLHGRAVVWGARNATGDSSVGADDDRVEQVGRGAEAKVAVGAAEEQKREARFGGLGNVDASASANERLERHIRTLFALTEPEQMTTANEEEAVADVDDRLKRAIAKAKVIERIVGEQHVHLHADGGSSISGHDDAAASGRGSRNATGGEPNIEDFTVGSNIRTGG